MTQTAALTGDSQLQGKAGSFTLLSSGNNFSVIALNATGGDIQVADSAAVILSGNTASANIYLAAPSETLNGVMTAGGTLGLRTDSFSRTSGSLSGTTVELAPLTPGVTESLGSGSGLLLSDVSFITTNFLRAGAVNVPGSGQTITAGSIAIGGAFGSASLPLELDTTGAVTQTAALTAPTLTGSAASVALSNIGNLIGTLGAFTTSNGFALTSNESLTVSGVLTNSKAGQTVTLNTQTGDMTIAANIAAANDTLDLVSVGTVSQTGGSIVAASLTGSVAALSLIQPTNQIGTIATLSATGSLAVNDASPDHRARHFGGRRRNQPRSHHDRRDHRDRRARDSRGGECRHGVVHRRGRDQRDQWLDHRQHVERGDDRRR